MTESDALLPMFKAIKKKLKEQGCKRAILVGHNAHFDHSFIFAAIDRLKAASKSPFHPFSVIDTASLSMLMLGQSVLQKACYAAHVDLIRTVLMVQLMIQERKQNYSVQS